MPKSSQKPAAEPVTTKSAAIKPVAVKAPGKGDHIFLVDGSSYIFRAYHALPPLNRKSDGLQVNAVLGFCNMLWKLLRDMPPDNRPTHLAIIFDKSEITFRNKLYPDYKAHRPPAPDDLIPQFPLIREYGDLETLLLRAGEIKQPKRREALIENAEKARISRQLVLLDDKVKLDVPLDELAVHEPDARKLIAFLKAMEFSSLTRRVADYAQIDPADVEADSGNKSAKASPPLPLAGEVDALGS